MIVPQIEILVIACLVSVACVIPGVFLVLRGVSLMSDAISHAILLGIVAAFFVIHDLNSPFLLLGASLAGVLTVSITEALIKTNRMKKDAAIGLVFPVFFSIGVIVISKFAGHLHLDVDSVLLGEIAFAPFNRLYLFGIDLGPKAMVYMGGILVMNLLCLIAFYKEFKLTTFDSGLALSMGFSPVFFHYLLMIMTSLTAVAAFDAVGSILVVALMIAPPSTAYLLTSRLSRLIVLSMVTACLSSVLGYGVASYADISIAGSMVSVSGVLFVLALLFSQDKGIVPKLVKAKQQKLSFASSLLLVQLLSHEGTDKEPSENTVSNMVHHMNWRLDFANKVTSLSVQSGYIERQGNRLFLTALGRENARQLMRY